MNKIIGFILGACLGSGLAMIKPNEAETIIGAGLALGSVFCVIVCTQEWIEGN